MQKKDPVVLGEVRTTCLTEVIIKGSCWLDRAEDHEEAKTGLYESMLDTHEQYRKLWHTGFRYLHSAYNRR